jgi:hypothetical protein
MPLKALFRSFEGRGGLLEMRNTEENGEIFQIFRKSVFLENNE